MITLKLLFPVFTLLSGLIFYYFPKVIWNNLFVCIHRGNQAYLYRSNRFIGKGLIISTVFFLILALIPQITLLALFWTMFVVNVFGLPIAFEWLWRSAH